MLVDGLDRRRLAEVDAHPVAEDGFAVEDLPDPDGRVDVVEGDDDAAEGFEWGPRVQRRGLVDQVADGEEVRGVEDGGVLEVLEKGYR